MVSQLENERYVHTDMLQLFKKSMEEEQEVQKFIDDELHVQRGLKKACEEEYARNVHYIVKMLLTAFNVRNIILGIMVKITIFIPQNSEIFSDHLEGVLFNMLIFRSLPVWLSCHTDPTLLFDL